MSITEFINSHPMINWGGVEKMIGAPKGTIRVNSNRSIPAKYEPLIMCIIGAYGYVNDMLPQQPAIAENPVDTVSTDMLEFTFMDGKLKYITTDDSVKSTTPNGISVYVKEDDLKLFFPYKKCV